MFYLGQILICYPMSKEWVVYKIKLSNNRKHS